MSPKRKAASALPAVTALLVFLAKHPEIAELPLSWEIQNTPDSGFGIWVHAEHLAPNGAELLAMLARALRSKVDARQFTSHDSGKPTTVYSVYGSAGGVSVSSNAFVETAALGGAE